MPACLTCGFDNTITATVCVHCHRSLVDDDFATDDATPRRRPALLETLNQASSQALAEDNRSSGPGSLLFYIERDDTPIIVEGARQVILGRCTPDITAPIGVDLEPFNGAERGVSRAHAAIRCMEYGLEIEDLASTNGTWLNGEKLAPFIPRSLHSGDHLRLGLLGMMVYVR